MLIAQYVIIVIITIIIIIILISMCFVLILLKKHNPLGIIILQEGQIISADFVDRPHCFILDLSTESYVFQVIII